MTDARLGELEEVPVDLSDVQFDAAVQKAHALKPAAEINETVNNQANIESMILANTNMQSYAVADVLYDFDGFALTNEDGTRELKNKAVNSDTPNGKLFSGNPIDFQGSQGIVTDEIILTSNKLSFLYKYTPSDTVNQYIVDCGSNPIVWQSSGLHRIYLDGQNYDFKELAINESIAVAVIITDSTIKVYYDGILFDEQVFVGDINLINRTWGICSARGLTAFADINIEYLAVVNDEVSESEIKRFTTEPEKALTDYGTNPDLKGVFVTDFSGSSDYISNMCKQSEKTIISEVFTIAPLLNSYAGTGSITPTSENFTKWVSDGFHQRVTYSEEFETIKQFLIDHAEKYFIFEVEVRNYVSGEFRFIFDGDGNPSSDNINSNGIHLSIVKSEADFDQLKTIPLSTDGTVPIDLELRINRIELLESIHKIQGYNDTQRTNFQTQATGYQHLLVERNELGFTDGLSKTLNFYKSNGVLRRFDGNVSLFSNEDWTCELGISFVDTKANYSLINCTGLSFGIHGKDSLYLRVGNKLSLYNSFRDIDKVFYFSYNSTSKTLKVMFDDESHTIDASEYDNVTQFMQISFEFNNLNYRFEKPILLYNKYKKALTKDETVAMQKLRKSQYPTLNLGAE